MDDTTDAGSRGEASSSSADGALVEYMNGSIVVGQIPEEIFIMIFCKLPLRTLFQMQIICTSWQSTIFERCLLSQSMGAEQSTRVPGQGTL